MKPIIDRTPNGTLLSMEDPLKMKLKRIADQKMTLPSPELIIWKIKDQIDSKLLGHSQSKSILKSAIIKSDNEPTHHINIKKLGFL